ncbi:hypothetical protein LGK97_05725 [Clostridium sp. CS001]|uniref:hypothetical protein n=1 Tax=Clostridium sp. CS001 TaxID=2880648 RepID=UPI001CF1B9CA|nr:hypothetical protein [Clostridium sp. CS001]MCB2289262.1 hypothetical protein [Clostridium sp. CS001]
MLKIQSEVNFGNENLECLIEQIIEEKIKEVHYKIKNRDIVLYNKNYPPENDSEEKVDETK